MKVAYGKPVRKPAPSVKNRPADEPVLLVARDPAIPPSVEVLAAIQAAEVDRPHLAATLRVPDLLPVKPHC